MAVASESSHETPPRGWWIAAAVIVGVAVFLRFWRLHWGIDDGITFSDEATLFRRYTGDFVPLRLASFDRPDRPSAFLYPTLQGYVVGLTTWLSTSLGIVLSPWEEQVSGIRVGRVVAASQSVLVVCLVGLLAARARGVRAGLFAAGLMAVAPMPVMQAHYISTDPLVIFLMTAALWAACSLQETGRTSAAFGGGLLVGLAFATKYSGLVAGVAIAWAASEVAWRERRFSRFVTLGVWAVLGLALGVLVGCPLCVWRAGDVLEILSFYGSLTSYENLMPWRVDLAPGLGGLGRPYVYQLLVALPFATGWGIYALGVTGLVAAAGRRCGFDRILLVTLGAYVLSAGLSRSFELRYVLHIVPVLVLLASGFLVSLERRRLAVGVFAFVALYSFALSLSQVARFSYGNQWAVTTWLNEEVRGRTGSPVIVVPGSYFEWTGLKVPFRRFELPYEIRSPGEWLDGDPDFVVLPDLLADSVRTRPLPKLRGDLDRLESGEAGYVAAGHWRTPYLSESLHTSLDPVLRGSYTQGSVGFRVFVRRAGPS